MRERGRAVRLAASTRGGIRQAGRPWSALTAIAVLLALLPVAQAAHGASAGPSVRLLPGSHIQVWTGSSIQGIQGTQGTAYRQIDGHARHPGGGPHGRRWLRGQPTDQFDGWSGNAWRQRGAPLHGASPGSLVNRPPLHAVPPPGLTSRAPLHALPTATARALAEQEQARMARFRVAPRCVVPAESRFRNAQRWQAPRTGCVVSERVGRRGRDRSVD